MGVIVDLILAERLKQKVFTDFHVVITKETHLPKHKLNFRLRYIALKLLNLNALMIIKQGFRYDINGLRAFAVIVVLFFHFKVPFFTGGFSGVDIFYVISGFLMTKIIITGIEKDNFSLLTFYKKRIQRIIPGLAAMVIIVLVICFFLYMPNDYREVTKNGSGSLLFVSNIVYAFSGGYFGNSADNNVFLHTWSLSVEWQFYLLLPVVLIYFNRYIKYDRNTYARLFVISIVIIFLGTLVVTRYRPNHSFYLLPTRTWEMLAGGLAFLVQRKIQERYRKILAIAAYLILLLGVVFLHEDLKWPGFYTLAPVVATFLILVTNVNEFAILKTKPVLFFGKISYSLYLWHWPVFVIGNYVGVPTTPINAVYGIVLSLILGYLSYRYVESLEINKNRYIVATTSVASLVAFCASLTYVNTSIFKENTIKISGYENVHKETQRKQFGIDSCFITSKSNGLEGFSKKRCLPIQKGRRNILLIGDSHAAQFYQPLKAHFAQKSINLGQVTASSCLPLRTPEGPGPGNCEDLLKFVFKELLPENAADIESIILSGNWVDNQHGKEQLLKDIKSTGAYLEQLGIKFVILGQTETYKIDFCSIAAQENEYGIENSEDYLDSETEEVNAYLKAGLKDKYIDLFRLQHIKKVSANHIPYMFDQNHLTVFGVKQVLEKTVYRNKSFLSTIDN